MPDAGRAEKGVLLGCGSQIAVGFLGQSFWTLAGFASWIVMLPLAAWLHKRGESEAVKGLFFVGFIGLLVSSLCAIANLSGVRF